MNSEHSAVLLKPAEVAQLLRIGRTKVYDLINRRELPTISLGTRCTRISRAALAAWIDKKAT